MCDTCSAVQTCTDQISTTLTAVIRSPSIKIILISELQLSYTEPSFCRLETRGGLITWIFNTIPYNRYYNDSLEQLLPIHSKSINLPVFSLISCTLRQLELLQHVCVILLADKRGRQSSPPPPAPPANSSPLCRVTFSRETKGKTRLVPVNLLVCTKRK